MIKFNLTHWKTQINILWLGQSILMAMLAMSAPYWPLYISQLGHFSPYQVRFWSAAIYMAPFITSIFSSPLWGKLGDKYGYKPMVIRACFGLFVTQTLILFFSDVYLIFIIRLLQGVLAGFLVAAQSWSLTISPLDQRGATIGKLQSATAVGNLLGPLLGGVIATFFGYYAIFTSSSIICAGLTIVFCLLLQNPKSKNIVELKNEKNTTLGGFFQLHSFIIPVLFTILFIQLARSIIIPIFALFVTQKLGGNDIMVGVLYASTGLMIFLTSTLWGNFFDKRIKAGRSINNIISMLLFISASLQFFHAYATTVTEILILRLLWGICLGALLPALLRLLVDNSDPNKCGFLLGFGNSATKFGNLLGILAGSLIEGLLGYSETFFITGIIYIFSGIVIFWFTQPLKSNNKILSIDSPSS